MPNKKIKCEDDSNRSSPTIEVSKTGKGYVRLVVFATSAEDPKGRYTTVDLTPGNAFEASNCLKDLGLEILDARRKG